MIAEAVVTAGMIAQWKEDPASVPAEWRSFWQSMGGAVQPADDEGAPRVREATYLDALAHVAEARDRAEDSLAAAVGQARALGHAWSEIGAAIGVSRQAAQQRYGS